jgi:predicted N-acetyltransferase YhbS
MWEIRPETGADAADIEALSARSFGPGRYAKSAYRLREGVEPEGTLGFVAFEHGALRGSVRFWPVCVGALPVLLLGPLAVDSEQRGRGIGIALMQTGIDVARALGHRAIILVGDPPYYARVGFAPLPRGRVRLPGPVDPARLLGIALTDGTLETLSGAVTRARIDRAVCACGAGVGGAAVG